MGSRVRLERFSVGPCVRLVEAGNGVGDYLHRVVFQRPKSVDHTIRNMADFLGGATRSKVLACEMGVFESTEVLPL